MSGSGSAIFDYTFWATIYPEFNSTVFEPQAQECFNTATLFLDNSGFSLVPLTYNGQPMRVRILGMITAQIAQLYYGSAWQGVSPLVGRMSSASQGSVSTSTEMAGAPFEAAWFLQTKYGFMAWQALQPFMSAVYIAPPQVPLGAQSWPGGAFGGVPIYFPVRG
jgi:hypothetical protein